MLLLLRSLLESTAVTPPDPDPPSPTLVDYNAGTGGGPGTQISLRDMRRLGLRRQHPLQTQATARKARRRAEGDLLILG